MAIQTVFLTENTTAYATDVMNLVTPLYNDIDGSNVGDKTGTGTTLVLSASPTFTGTTNFDLITLNGITGDLDISNDLTVDHDFTATAVGGTIRLGRLLSIGDITSGGAIYCYSRDIYLNQYLSFSNNLLYLNNSDNSVLVNTNAQLLNDSVSPYKFVIDSGSGRGGLLLQNSNNTSGNSIVIKAHQHSLSPTAGDQTVTFIGSGNNTNGDAKDYFKYRGTIEDATAGNESGGFIFQTFKSGTDSQVLSYDGSTSIYDFKDNDLSSINNISRTSSGEFGCSIAGSGSFFIDQYSSSTTYNGGLRLGRASGTASCTIGAVNTSITSPTVYQSDLMFTCTAGAGANYSIIFGLNSFRPLVNHSTDLGSSSRAWNEVFAYTYTTISDERLKENIEPIKSVTPLLRKLNPVTFNYIGSEKIQETGHIAQEVLKATKETGIAKDLISKPKSKKDYYTIKDNHFPAILVKAWQELDARLTQLEKGE